MKWLKRDVGVGRRLSWSPLATALWTIAFAEVGLLVSIGADAFGPHLHEDSIYLSNAGYWTRTLARVIEFCHLFPWEGCFLPLIGGLLRCGGRLVPTLAILAGGFVGFLLFLPALTGTHTGRTWPLMAKAIPGTLYMAAAVLVAVLYAAAFSWSQDSKQIK